MRARWMMAALLAGGLGGPAEALAACDGDPDCSGGPARVMIVLDASSDLLNDGNAAATMGNTAWDVVREVVAGPGDSLYDAPVEPPGPVASQVIHFGLAVLGDAADGDGRILVDYAPCSEPRVDWALDPRSSCLEPGCTDPWGGPPITWTSQDGSQVDPPGFTAETLSHMPRCDGNSNRCEGSGRFVVPGLSEVRSHQSLYAMLTPYVHDGTTRYVNVLIVTGEYDDADADVEAALVGSFIDGITTYVVGFHDAPTGPFEGQLASMAGWGSDGTLTHRVATNPGELASVLDEIIDELALPCCASIDCAYVGGADSGADSADGTAGDAGADWGGADGTAGDTGATGGVSAGTAGGSASMTDTSGEIDDDGGCTCRTGPAPGGRPLSWLLPLLGLALARRRRSAA